MLAALKPEFTVLDQRNRRAADLDPRILQREHHAPAALDAAKFERQRGAVCRRPADALDLVQLLLA